jgi:tryptophan halogenase
MKIDNIVIVGGGSAGWMTASTLVKFFPNKNITVIEPKNISRVGVGESTLQSIRAWLSFLEIDDSEWMKDCDAVYKLSIKFTDFYEKDYGSFHYPFGVPDENNTLNGLSDWFSARALQTERKEKDFCRSFWCQMDSIENNRIPTEDFDQFVFRRDSAFHFDALKFADWLKNNYCIPKGVKLISDEVIDVKLTNDNHIDSLLLSSKQSIKADLFVDCSGFQSLLLDKKMGVNFHSFDDKLPNNRAWATRVSYLDKEKELEVYTNCTALGNGWCWNIPLWSRIGCGYVYSDHFTTPDKALEEFENYLNSDKMKLHCSDRTSKLKLDFKDIKIRSGYSERIWHNNVVGIGLSAAFIEPLESNGLMTIYEFLIYLVDTISNRPKITSFDIDCFNFRCIQFIKGFADFISMHYMFSTRDDTDYWKSATNDKHLIEKYLNDSINYQDLLSAKTIRNTFGRDLEGINCIAAGCNISPFSLIKTKQFEFLNNMNFDVVVENFKNIDDRKKYWYDRNKNFPTAYDFYKETIYKD